MVAPATVAPVDKRAPVDPVFGALSVGVPTFNTEIRIVDAETRAVAGNPVQRVMDSGEIVTLANHTTLLARDGSPCAIADSAAPIRNRLGELFGVVLVFADVTEQTCAAA